MATVRLADRLLIRSHAESLAKLTPACARPHSASTRLPSPVRRWCGRGRWVTTAPIPIIGISSCGSEDRLSARDPVQVTIAGDLVVHEVECLKVRDWSTWR